MAFLAEFFQMVKDMVGGEYPPYVMKGLVEDEVPVFVYHRVDEKQFEEQLQYLKKNEYRTLNMIQLEKLLSQGQKPSEKDIVLTFDDGLDDLYSVAYPLLRTYECQAVAFIAPYWIGEKGVVNWEQVKEMHQSGVVDFQAHSYTHGRIYVSPKIEDFFHPGFRYHHRWQFPLMKNGSGHISKELPPFGMPIYQFASSLSESKKYLGNRELEAFCIDYIENRGGEVFFHRPFWRNHLRRAICLFSRDNPIEYCYETEEERNTRIDREIKQSKEIIEEKLPGKQVSAFSYPYYEASKLADRLLKKYAYRFIFGGIKKRPINESDNEKLQFFRRVNGDFIRRLKGYGKVSLCRLLSQKSLRRLSGTSAF